MAFAQVDSQGKPIESCLPKEDPNFQRNTGTPKGLSLINFRSQDQFSVHGFNQELLRRFKRARHLVLHDSDDDVPHNDQESLEKPSALAGSGLEGNRAGAS